MDAEYLHGFYLGDMLVEPLRRRVSGKNGSQHLPPKAAEVLLCLARRAGEVVDHDELLEKVWGSGQGTREALSHAIGEIRNALGDHHDHPAYIQTIPRRGYRLVVKPISIDDPAETQPQTVQGPRWWQALLRHGVVQAGAVYLVSGWLLIQIADTTFENIGLPAWSEQFVTFVVIGGFPLLLALAWFLEFVEGRMEADRGEQSGNLFQGLERNYVAIFIAYGIAAIGAGVYQATIGFEVVEVPTEASANVEPEILPVVENSIAVLRLATFDDDPTAKAFSDGLSEDILDALARISGLSVSARGDAWSLPPHASSDVVRRRLRVAHYIEGSVRFLEDRLRVVIQFIDSDTGFHRFSRNFEIDIVSIGDMQREITELVIANLKLAVDMPAVDATHFTATAEQDAYLLYLLGREATIRPRAVENFEEAISYYNQALEVDPGYPAAHAGLCSAHVSLFELREDAADIERARESCSQAMSVAPQLAVVSNSVARLYRRTGRATEAADLYIDVLERNGQDSAALRGLASIRLREQRYDEAEGLMRRAIELQPGNWRALSAIAGLYFRTGRYADASREYRKVVFLDPDNFITLGNLATTSMMHGDFAQARDAMLRSLNIQEDPTYLANLAIAWYYTGDFNDAVDTYRRAIELAPKSVANSIGLADSLHAAGRTEEALRVYESSAELAREHLAVAGNDSEALAYLAWAQAMNGEFDAARATVQRAIELAPGDYYVHYYEALVELRAGDMDAAVAAAENALDAGYPVAVLAAEPILEDLWNHSRFVELMARHSVGGQRQ